MNELSHDYELVRVAKGIIGELLAQDPQPVVLVGLERQDDGTIELIFRTPDLRPSTGSQETHAQVPPEAV